MNESHFPSSLGYTMPAEWEPHAATWLNWPHNNETWLNQDMSRIEEAYLEIIRALIPGEQVHMLVQDQVAHQKISALLAGNNMDTDSVHLHIIPTDDSWIRDYGPNFLVRLTPGGREVACNKWNFDSWGGKYDWDKDNAAGGAIAGKLNIPRFDPGIVLEGGAIEVNGRGICMTTESCLLNKNRNGGMDRGEMEEYLKNYLGVKKIVWLNGDLEGDDTDGHIDNLARFVNPTTILCAYEEDASEKNFQCLKSNLEILNSTTDQDGDLFNVVQLPMPGYVGDRSTRLPASYANFYIGNQAVLVPAFGKPSDLPAINIIKQFFPERTVARIPSEILIWGLGSIHCLTQQQPLAL